MPAPGPSDPRVARAVHTVVAVIVWASLLVQLWLAIDGTQATATTR